MPLTLQIAAFYSLTFAILWIVCHCNEQGHSKNAVFGLLLAVVNFTWTVRWVYAARTQQITVIDFIYHIFIAWNIYIQGRITISRLLQKTPGN